MTRKFILTGGPCTGKTETLKAMESEGFQVMTEAARIVIEREQAKGSDSLPWLDRDKFQKAVLEKQLELESRLEGGKDTFLDRGVPDGLVYYRLDGIEPPKELLEAAKNHRYDKVFVLDMLPNYKTDEARKEDPETMKRIHQLVKEIYRELGYDIVEVPPASVKERVKLIMARM